MLMLDGLLSLLMILMAFGVEAALAFFLARHSWQWSGERYPLRVNFIMIKTPRLLEQLADESLRVDRIPSLGQDVDKRKGKWAGYSSEKERKGR